MARKVKTKDPHKLILDAARELLVDKGPENMTIRNISKKSNYSLGAVYVYFDNINDIILQINGAALEELYNIMSQLYQKLPHSTNSVVAICLEYLDYSLKNKEIWSSVMTYRRTGKEKRAGWYKSRIDLNLKLVQEIVKPHIKKPADREATANILWAGMHGIWHLATREGFEVVSKTEAKRMIEIMVKHLLR